MVALVLILSLAQAPDAAPVDVTPSLTPDPSTSPELAPDTREVTTEQRILEESKRRTQRVFLSTGAGVLGSGAGLGIALAFSLPNPTFDSKFATSALCALLVAGGAFLVHQAMRGQGEVMFGLLGSIVAMVAATFVANAIDQTVPTGPILTAAIGALPGAALAVLGLELSSTNRRRAPVKVSFAPTSVVVAF
jgi:peptidoglycan/LPS O-acetylase OafA/YrhL